jgi:hypothetical protein
MPLSSGRFDLAWPSSMAFCSVTSVDMGSQKVNKECGIEPRAELSKSLLKTWRKLTGNRLKCYEFGICSDLHYD